MFVVGNLLSAIAAVLDVVLQALLIIIFVNALLSWVRPDPRNPIVQFLYMVTEPPIHFVRRLLPMNLRYFPLDIAFLVVFGLVIFIQYGIVPSIYDLGVRMKRPAY